MRDLGRGEECWPEFFVHPPGQLGVESQSAERLVRSDYRTAEIARVADAADESGGPARATIGVAL